MVKVTERGWAGHFICSDRCRFTRNTLIQGDTDSVIVSTVGNFVVDGKMNTIGANGRYYETMVFGVYKESTSWYLDADVSDQRYLESNWSICADSPEDLPGDVDNIADRMHEEAVQEFKLKLES